MRYTIPVLITVHFVVGVGVMVAVALTQEMVIGHGQFDRVVDYLEEFDFKWWTLGVVFGVWLLPLLVVTALRRAQQAGYRVDELRRILHSLVDGHSIPVVIDIDQKVPLQLSALDVPVRLHTKVDLDDTIAIQMDVPIQTDLPLDTDIHARIPGLGEITIPIRAKVPVDVIVPIRGKTHIEAYGVPIDVNEIAVAELPAVEIPVRFRLEAKIDILRNLLRAEQLMASPDTPWVDRLRSGWARLRGISKR